MSKYCSRCGEEVKEDQKYCSNCGNNLNKSEKDEKITEKRKSKETKNRNGSGLSKKYLIAIFLLLILGAFIAFIITTQGGNTYDGKLSNPTSEQAESPDSNQKSSKVEESQNKETTPVCGDGVCEDDESYSNCCVDCSCPSGKTCEGGECIVLKPEFSSVFKMNAESNSVTYLKAKGRDLGEYRIENTGNDEAKNVKITLSTPRSYFSETTVDFFRIDEGERKTKGIDLNFNDKALEVTTTEHITVNAEINYENSIGEDYSTSDSFEITLEGRNYLTWTEPKMAASWVTPTQPSVREFASKATSGLAAGMENSDTSTQKMAARWLFEAMRSYGVGYVNDAHSSGDYIQFPRETLNNKAGDCDDQAILYASLLESIGMKSFLVLVPGHIYSGYINSEGEYVPIETTASDFDAAISRGAYQYNNIEEDSATIFKPSEIWYKYPQVNLPEKISLNMPSITKRINSDCELSMGLSMGVYARSIVEFTNSGESPGAGCASMVTYDDKKDKIDEDISCWTINPEETREIEYKSDISIGDVFNGYYCRTR